MRPYLWIPHQAWNDKIIFLAILAIEVKK